jgi:hypothetical protein
MSKSGIVYKLCCDDTDIEECYVGSTKNFNRRRTAHKGMCNNEKDRHYNIYVYQFIRANGGFNNWRMIQLEVVNYETRRDLEAFERKWIEQLKPELNKQLPGRTQREYLDLTKKKRKEKMKEWYNKNKYTINERIQQYDDEKKNEILKYKKEWYNKQKNNINEKRKQKIKCIYCNTEVRKDGLTQHNKSGRHIYNYIYY